MLKLNSDQLLQLVKFMRNTKKITDKKGIHLILNCVRLQTKNNQVLTIQATNLDNFVQYTIDNVLVDTNLDVCINAKELLAIGKVAKTMSIEVNNKTLEVTIITNKCNLTLQAISGDEYPVFNTDGFVNCLSVNTKAFQQALKLNITQACKPYTSASNNVLEGVAIVPYQGLVAVAATDGNRLSESKVDANTDTINRNPIILRQSTIALIQKLDSRDSIKILTKNNEVLIQSDSTSILSHVIEGRYPDYEKLIPAGYERTVTFSFDELLQAIKQVEPCINKQSRDKPIRLIIEGKKLIVVAKSPDKGEAKAEIHLVQKTGDNLEICFNYLFLLDTCKNFAKKEGTAYLGNPLSPAIFKSKEILEYLNLIMPVRVRK